MRIFKFLARSVVAITLAGVAAKANAQSIDELYQAAKKEGVLSLNGGGLAGLYEPWVQEFERRFPGIKVKLTADFSNILAPIIDREIAERKLSVDLTIFQTLQDYDRWKKQGVLMSFRPEGWDQIHQSFKDPDGQYVGVAVYALSYAYNTQAIAGIDVPGSAQDFLKPEFKGKVITCYPNDDDVTLYLFYTIVQKYGWKFMDKYMPNNPQWVRGHLGTARAVASDFVANCKPLPYWFCFQFLNPGRSFKDLIPRLFDMYRQFSGSTHGSFIGSVLFSDSPDASSIDPQENLA